MKTFDRALSRGIWDAGPWSTREYLADYAPPRDRAHWIYERSMVELPAQSAVYEVTNVHRLLAADQRDHIFETRFPCVAPPKPMMWFEWDAGTGQGTRRGAFVQDETDEMDDEYTHAQMAAEDARSKLYLPRPRWALGISLFIDDGNRVISMGGLTVALNGDGRIVGNHYAALTTIPEYGPEWLLHRACVPLMAISLMHARNTTLVGDPEPPPRLARRHRQRHGRLPVRMTRIHLQLPRPQGARRGCPPPTTETLVGTHAVDGHFAHYGNCCPETHPPNGLLFGKHTGTIWVPSHVRGDPELGTIGHEARIVETETS